ncbi:hypothetical protein RGQ29_016201 [Quercus rubra]|uniref:CC-NBS-LRR protein n=1 Tax=Quercus rubra TaxID=3512 RepID=A0AAN7IZ79_QUERU|nr:hypothetical protein RGQ29_016201 [Quercus rubra]
MDEAILSSVAGSIIENLGSAAFEQVGSLWNVKDDLKQIRKTVSTIKAVLQDAAEEQNHNHQDRVWLEMLKEAVFDADDLLDESKYYTELALRQKETSGSFTEKVRYFLSSISVVLGRPKMSLKISKLSQELDAIAKDREKFHRKERSTVKRIVSPNRETLPWLPNNGVIGREDEKNQIIDRLLEPNNEENVLVVAIVGITGIGKTTLAQCVYNDDRVDTQFELKLSMCFSNVFEVTTFAEKLVNGIDKDDSIELRLKKRRKFNLEVLMDQFHNMDPLRKLVNKIYQKKFVVVLDDLWNENCKNWNDFKSLLINGAKGSRIIITTRDKSVVNITRADATYFLEGLSEDHSWSVFEKFAFEKGQDTKNPTLVDYGREIVGKCQGVPLVLKSIGNVLYSKKPHEWSKIRDKVVKNVIEEGGNTFPILRLSYDNLPSYLKGCFAFFSLFPKDYVIDKMTVIQLWMAHGFIQLSNDTQQVEDVANEYFEDLLSNFLEKRNKGYGVLKYKMHDYIMILHYQLQGQTSFPSLRALDLHGLKIEIMTNSIVNLIHLKYLDLSFNPIKTLPDSITALLNLQTLKLQECCNLEQLPRDITKLVSLRHLDDRGCFKLRLPQELRKLTGLQSLSLFIVRNNGGLGELNGLNSLKGTLRDRNFRTIGRFDFLPSKIFCNHLPPLSKLPFLESLWLDEMKDLECISDLDISEEVSTLSFFPSLKSLSILECPNLKEWWRSASMTDHQQQQHNRSLPSFPCLSSFWIDNCPNMTSVPLFPYLEKELTLRNVSSKLFQETILPSSSSSSSSHPSKLKSMWISNLLDVVSLPDGWASNLISLEHLYIYNCKELNLGSDVDGMEWRHLNRLIHLSFYDLPKLNSPYLLDIGNCENLKILPRWIGNLISLKRFTIEKCLNLKSLPDEMRDLSSLQKLEIFHCPE